MAPGVLVAPTRNVPATYGIPVDTAPHLKIKIHPSPRKSFSYVGMIASRFGKDEARKLLFEINKTYGLDLKMLNVQNFMEIAKKDMEFVNSVFGNGAFWLTTGLGHNVAQIVRVSMDEQTAKAIQNMDLNAMLTLSNGVHGSDAASIAVRAKHDNLSFNYF